MKAKETIYFGKGGILGISLRVFMTKLLVVEGGVPLKGEVTISGAKNAALPIMAASLLSTEACELNDIPALKDVKNMMRIMEGLGVGVQEDGRGCLSIDPQGLHTSVIPDHLFCRLRASYYLWGVLLAKTGYVKSILPGGCQIGNRPVDLHLKGFRALGAQVVSQNGSLEIWAHGLKGARIYLDYPSVGATINSMLAASLAQGETIIENAAKEPEIVDLSNFLTIMGGKIRGSGTDVIKIQGVDRLGGTEHRIIPDRIEAGTFMLATAITGGDVYVNNVLVEHVKSVIAKLREMGLELKEDISGVSVRSNGILNSVDIKTLPFPGFPSDLQAQGMTLLTQSQGPSQVQETVWEKRFNHVAQLKRMGADIVVRERMASINPGPLTGARVMAKDLRAGAALILAGLVASGKTEIDGLSHIHRGYEGICSKLQSLGASISLKEEVADPHRSFASGNRWGD